MGSKSRGYEKEIDVEAKFNGKDIMLHLYMDYSLSGNWSRGYFNPVSGAAEPPDGPDINFEKAELSSVDPEIIFAFNKLKDSTGKGVVGDVDLKLKCTVQLEEDFEEEIEITPETKFLIEEDSMVFYL